MIGGFFRTTSRRPSQPNEDIDLEKAEPAADAKREKHVRFACPWVYESAEDLASLSPTGEEAPPKTEVSKLQQAAFRRAEELVGVSSPVFAAETPILDEAIVALHKSYINRILIVGGLAFVIAAAIFLPLPMQR